jgi:recombination protein RecA
VPSLFVWDSIASCATKDEVEKGLGGKEIWDSRAKTLSHACRVLSKIAKEKGTTLLFVNQVREKIGVMFGDKYTTPGGKAVKFCSSIRIQLFPGKSIKNSADEHTGKLITFLTTKNRLASPYRKARVRLDYDAGWNDYWSTMEHAKITGAASADVTRSIEKMGEPARSAARAELLKATLPLLKVSSWRKQAVEGDAPKPEEGAQVEGEGEEAKEAE